MTAFSKWKPNGNGPLETKSIKIIRFCIFLNIDIIIGFNELFMIFEMTAFSKWKQIYSKWKPNVLIPFYKSFISIEYCI